MAAVSLIKKPLEVKQGVLRDDHPFLCNNPVCDDHILSIAH